MRSALKIKDDRVFILMVTGDRILEIEKVKGRSVHDSESSTEFSTLFQNVSAVNPSPILIL
jgi:hypothetical protein